MGFGPTPTLTGALVELRPADDRAVAALHTALGDREVTVLTGSTNSSEFTESPGYELDALQSIYATWAADPTRHVWAIIDRSDDSVIGEVLLMELDESNRSCGFRIWIAGARGRGLGTEATRLAVGHGFEVEQLHRIELEVYAFNPRARHVYEKVGFTLEGTKRDALRFDDGWIDAHLMAILAPEWFAAQDRPSTHLAG